MVVHTLPERAASRKSVDRCLDRAGTSDPGHGSVVVRLDLTGIHSIEILADQSAMEACLLEHLQNARPALERLHVAMRS